VERVAGLAWVQVRVVIDLGLYDEDDLVALKAIVRTFWDRPYLAVSLAKSSCHGAS